MTFLSDLVGLRSLENPARPLTDASLLNALGGMPSSSGVPVTEHTAMSMITMFRGVALISGTIAGSPLHVYDRKTKERKPTPACLTFPKQYANVTAFEHWETTVAHKILWGKGISYKHRSRVGEVKLIKAIHPARVRVDVIDDKETQRISGKPYVLRFTIDNQLALTEREILHIPGLSLDGITGVTPLTYIRESLGAAVAAEQAAAKMFGKGLMLSGVLETDSELEEEAATALKRRWNATYGGVTHAGEIAILDHGAKFHQLAMNPADAQFLETRKFSVSEIARFLGLPGWLLNDQEKSTSWGTGMEQQFIAWVQTGLKLDLQRIEQRVTRELLDSDTEYAEFSLEGLLRGDTKARAAFYASGIQHGWLVPNDVRPKENLQPVPWGDKPYRPYNHTAADQTAQDDSNPGGTDDGTDN